MLYILKAVANPSDTGALSTAISTKAFGLSAKDIVEMKLDQARWDVLVDRFEEFREIWHSRGVYPMVMTLFSRFDIPKNLLSLKGGERGLTNLRHLAELLCQEERQEPGPERLIKWLSQRIQEPNDRAEEQQLRLESDENLVKIMSYHKSKGLEFPILFLPYIHRLAPKTKTGELKKYYDRQRGSYVCHIARPPGGEGAKKRLEEYLSTLYQCLKDRKSGQEDSSCCLPNIPENHRDDAERALAIEEQKMAEIVRLGYVAFTRAKYKIYFYLPERALPEFIRVPVDDTNGDAALEIKDRRFERLVEEKFVRVVSPRAKCREWKDISVGRADRKVQGPFAISKVTRSPLAPWSWRRLSFTSLSHSIKEDVPSPVLEVSLAHLDNAPLGSGEEPSAFTFPKGPRAGQCIHSLLEEMDFNWPVEKVEEKAKEVLLRYGLDNIWYKVLSEMALGTVSAPLGRGITLKGLDPKWISKEMEFSMDFDPRYLEGLGVDGLEEMKEGVLKGFMDLVFRHRDEFYIVDYKSNWFGPGPEAYSKEAMLEAMDEHNYWLQAAIYVKALEKFLNRIKGEAGLEYKVAGAYYLFIRSLGLEDEGSGNGVVFVSTDELKERFPNLVGN
ncbi:MAG: hypothetical protein GXO58_10295 [Thermodesulfobacteria bacterium]|nr:hypothetical protein [Thermodesulfobacteriota bacterium]